MLDDQLKAQLREQFEKLQHPVELVLASDHASRGDELQGLLQEVAGLSPRIDLVVGDDARKPSFSICRKGAADGANIRFACMPVGRQFTSLVLAILYTGGYTPNLDESLIARIAALSDACAFDLYISHDCFNCPESAQVLIRMAAINPRLNVTIIDGAWFPEEVQAKDVRVVPMAYLNGAHFGQGRFDIDALLEQLDRMLNAGAVNERRLV